MYLYNLNKKGFSVVINLKQRLIANIFNTEERKSIKKVTMNLTSSQTLVWT